MTVTPSDAGAAPVPGVHELWGFVELAATACSQEGMAAHLQLLQSRALALLAARPLKEPRGEVAHADSAKEPCATTLLATSAIERVDAASHVSTTESTVEIAGVDTSQKEKLCAEANERVARRMLERADSRSTVGDESEDKSDTLSDCTTLTETSSVYGVHNTWVDLAMLYSLPFVAVDGSSAGSGNGSGATNGKSSSSSSSSSRRLKPVPPLNITQELTHLNRIFQECQRSLHTMRAVATVDALRRVLDRGVTVLHFSGHGGRVAGKTNCLIFEDTQKTGLAHFIDATTLRNILHGGNVSSSATDQSPGLPHGLVREDSIELQDPSLLSSRSLSSYHGSISSNSNRFGLSNTLKLVFVSSCHSKDVGEVFIQAGVNHVVCVRSDERVLDEASAMFSYAFYHAVLAGKTIHQAFDVARVRVSADLQIPASESDKFILLESSHLHADDCPLYGASTVESRAVGTNDGYVDDEDSVPAHAIEVNFANNPCTCAASTMHFVFADISAGKWIDVSPTNRFAKTLPAVPDSFVGREQELHMLAGLVNAQRFVTMRGPPGIGKSTLSIRLAHFLAERNVFPDGVAFIRLRGVQSLEGMETAIKSALFPDGGREAEQPLHQVLTEMKVLLVMDNMEDPINAAPAAVREFVLDLLQNTPNLAFVMTARQAMGGGMAGVDEKVISLNRLSHYHAADLFLKKSPRALLLSEIGAVKAPPSDASPSKPGTLGSNKGAGGNSNSARSISVLEALTAHPLMAFLDGHPQAISLCAPLLQDRSLSELTRAVLNRGVSELQVVGLAANDRSAMNTLVTSLDVSLEQVRQQHGSDAIRFFALLGLLPAGAMPADFKSLWGSKWDSVVEILLRFSLIQRNRIPGFVLSNPRGDLSKAGSGSRSRGSSSSGVSSRRSSSRLSSSSRNSGAHSYDMALLSALKAYGEFISANSASSGSNNHNSHHGKSSDGTDEFGMSTTTSLAASARITSQSTHTASDKHLLNTFTRSGRASRAAEHVEKMDSQAEIMAVCVSYSTFPFITSYARSLLGLYDDDGAKNEMLESICIADRDVFLYNSARHFWKVSFWIFQHICTLTARSTASYLILDTHESNLWMILDLHMRMIDEWQRSSATIAGSTTSMSMTGSPSGLTTISAGSSPLAVGCSPDVTSMREKTSSYVMDVACFFAHALFLAGRHRGAWNAANKALHMAKYHRDTLSEANTRKLMGVLLTTETKFDEAKAQFGMALILYKATGDKLGQAASLSAIGMIHSRKGNLRGAHNCFTKALTLYEWFKHALGQLNCHQRLANLEKKLRDGDGMRGKNGHPSGHSHHYAATRRLQGDLNRKRNGEYIVRWVGHETSLLLELPPSKAEKVQEAHAPANVVMTSALSSHGLKPDQRSVSANESTAASEEHPMSSTGTPQTSVTNSPKKCRLGQIIDQREQAAQTMSELTLASAPSVSALAGTNSDSMPERLKSSSFARRKEYDAAIRRTISAPIFDSSSGNSYTAIGGTPKEPGNRRDET